MYLIIPRLYDIVKKQYFFKLKANIGLFTSLILLQLISLFFTQSEWGGNNGPGMVINFFTFSGDSVIIATLIWAFIISIILAASTNKNIDFTFVSNRLSSNLSNMAFMLTFAIYGAITAALSCNLLRLLLYIIKGGKNIYDLGFVISIEYFFVNIISIFLYIILISSIGYFIGSLSQLNRLLTIAFCTISLGLILNYKLDTQNNPIYIIGVIINFINLYFNVTSHINQALIFLLTPIIFITLSIMISNRLGVRK